MKVQQLNAASASKAIASPNKILVAPGPLALQLFYALAVSTKQEPSKKQLPLLPI
jgi:hypothetical protein